MSFQIAVVKVVFRSGVAKGFSVPFVVSRTTLEDAERAAKDFIRSHQNIPSDVANRVDYFICEVIDSVESRPVDHYGLYA